MGTKVYLINRSHKFRARKDFIEKLKKIENVEIIENQTLKEAKGSETLERIVTTESTTGDEFVHKIDGLFFAIGHDPNVFFFSSDLIKIDSESKYILVNRKG